jgi:hypothetical protein
MRPALPFTRWRLKPDSEQAAYRSGEPLHRPKIKGDAVSFASVEKMS